MKAIHLIKNGTAVSAFQTKEIDAPKPKQGEVLIKVAAFGLNYADVMARNGLYADAPPLPSVLGYEAVGTIEQIGTEVADFEIGQKVIAFTRFGAYAEYCIADQRAIALLPENISNGEAVALATQYCTAYYSAVEMVNLHEGDNVLIHAAAGGVGTALIQLVKQKGCTIYGTAGSQEKLDYLKQQGVDFPINYRKEDFAECIQKLNVKMDVIFDPVGGSSFKRDKTILAHGGRIICFGGSERSSGGIIQTLKFVLGFGFMSPIGLLMKSQSIIGVNMLRIADHKPHVLQRVINAVVELYKQSKIKPHVGGNFKASQIAEAHDFLENRKSIGKIVVEW
ncbi:MAG: zinc-binding dehydrogenase [Flavobacteriales bacterium]|nr:zinc-binding dehydrogenase [Flavobacteriales bacterium]